MPVPPNKQMLRPVGFVLAKTLRESLEHVTYETVNPYVEQCKRWNQKHPGACWILEQHSENTWWVNAGRLAISPIKTFRSKSAAIEWLDTQGANWLTAEQYDEILAMKKRRAAQQPHAGDGESTRA